MRKNNFIPIFVFIILLAASFICRAQKMTANPLPEKVTAYTDRTLYISGEQVLFSAFLTNDDHVSYDASHILYVEIISPDGKSISGSKFQFENHSASGCVNIPEETISGVYYVRAYTKFMRNAGPESFSYNPIKIVNPLRNDILEGPDHLAIANDLQTSTTLNDSYTLSTDKEE